jgi:predicted MPP superfamily phosphohydrolase
MIVFLSVVLSILGLIHWFLYSRLVSALGITSPVWLWTLRILAVYLAVSYIVSQLVGRHAPKAVEHVLDGVASLWIGLMWELLWLTALFALAKVVLLVTGVWGRLDPASTAAIGRWSVVAVMTTAVVLCGYAMTVAYGPARMVQVRIPVKKITPELRELRIVEASDFHTGLRVGKREIGHMAQRIMSLRPDLILLPGDIVDLRGDSLLDIAEAFRMLQARLGVFGTTGNHEYYIGLSSALEFCRAAGIRMLMNERVELPNGLLIAGIEDRTARQVGRPRPTVESVLGPEARTRPTIFLNHSPATDEARAAADAGADLILSGHTHGGQIWPFGFLSGLAWKYHAGLYAVGKGHIFTSVGIGWWGAPMRLGAPPEIVLIRLVGEHEPATVQQISAG